MNDRLNYWIYSSSGLVFTVVAIALWKIFDIQEVSPWLWLILVVGVDVAHVYSTIYRTYLNTEQRQKLRLLLYFTPPILFIFCVILAWLGTQIFWSVLALVAIFHFSRQQIGFSRWLNGREFWIECAIYAATLGSILLWILQGPKTFSWFTKNDFSLFNSLFAVAKPFYNFFLISVLAIFLVGLFRSRKNLQQFILLSSTFVSWFIPIVLMNSDFVFTMANVLAHGVPYLALVYSEERRTQGRFRQIELFFFLIVLLAIIEESLWDGFIWREHQQFFDSVYFLPHLNDTSFTAVLVISFLILPQLTHYVLDGFIWKRKNLQATVALPYSNQK